MSPAGGATTHTSPPPPIFLELTLISAQDLFPSSRPLRTYAITWLHPANPLRTRVDAAGHTHPTWNDRFLFRIDESILRSQTSAIQINIYASRHRFLPAPDTLLGTARAVLSTLIPSPSTRFVALQIRRPASLRPQGILNIAVAFPDPCVRSLTLYTNLRDSAIAYHDLMPLPKPGKKIGLKEIHPALPLPRPQPSSLPAGESADGSEDAESFILEKKLKKWRSEIWTAEDLGWEKGEKSPASIDEERGSVKGKIWRPRAMSCFNLAGQFEDEIEEEDDDCSTGSWSSQR